jgi:CBS domain-containing protein
MALTQICDVMTRGVRSLAPEDTVLQAAQAMQQLDVGAIPVCSENMLVGIVTDRDIVVRGVAASGLDAHTKIDAVMSRQPCWCFEDQLIDDVMALMRQSQVRRVPVIDRNNRLVGIVSLGDLAVRSDQGAAGAALRSISQAAQPGRTTTSRIDADGITPDRAATPRAARAIRRESR